MELSFFPHSHINGKNPGDGSKLGGGGNPRSPPYVEKPAWVGVGVNW